MDKDLAFLTYKLEEKNRRDILGIFGEADKLVVLKYFRDNEGNQEIKKGYIVASYESIKDERGISRTASKEVYFKDLPSLENFLRLLSQKVDRRKTLLDIVNAKVEYEKEFPVVTTIKDYVQPLNKEEIRRLKEFINSLYELVN